MKASDFTTGGNDREKAMSNLLKTEKTDAVNTGLVEKADKSAKALKGDLYSVGKKGTHGAGSTALDAIARKRKKTSAADALDGKSRSQLTGKNALTKKVQSRHNLNKSLKRGAKGVAAKAAHNALKDSELEGTDDLVATTHTGAKLAGKARKHLRSGKDALEKKDSLGALSEKKYRTEKLDKKAAQKRMQFSKYFHRNVYENAAAQAGKKKALTILSGGIKGMLSSLAGAVSQFFPLIIAFILAFGLISVVGGGAADAPSLIAPSNACSTAYLRSRTSFSSIFSLPIFIPSLAPSERLPHVIPASSLVAASAPVMADDPPPGKVEVVEPCKLLSIPIPLQYASATAKASSAASRRFIFALKLSSTPSPPLQRLMESVYPSMPIPSLHKPLPAFSLPVRKFLLSVRRTPHRECSRFRLRAS